MDNAQDRLQIGLHELQEEQPAWKRRQSYYEGDQDLPFAPEGVNDEYRTLQNQSPANWLGIAMDAPVQRLATESLRTPDDQVDKDTWQKVWVANRLESLEKIVFNQMMVHGRGIWSVSKNPANVDRPKVRVENTRRVYLHRDPEDPFSHVWAVKTWTMAPAKTTSLWVPDSVAGLYGAKQVGIVYDATGWVRFEQDATSTFGVGGWKQVDEGNHGLGEVPFVESGTNVDADGVPRSAISHLMPMQDALNTIRFNTLLAMQYSAFRQRIFTGYDPVARDAKGDIIYMTGPDGSPVLGPDGQPVPRLNQMGRIGVDRAIAFPGKDTKVFDLAESNLDNYIKAYQQFLSDLFALGQIPPQYALTKMANLSGDALAGAESTLQALITDLKREAQTGISRAMRLANVARGTVGSSDAPDLLTVDWADAEARSFAQIIDAIVKLISVKFPREAAFEMIPGANPTKVARWMELAKQERASEFSSKMLEAFTSEPLETETAPTPAA